MHGRRLAKALGILIAFLVSGLAGQAELRANVQAIQQELDNAAGAAAKMTETVAELRKAVPAKGKELAQGDGGQLAALAAVDKSIDDTAIALTNVDDCIGRVRAEVRDGDTSVFDSPQAVKARLDDAGRAIAKLTDRMSAVRSRAREAGGDFAQANVPLAAGMETLAKSMDDGFSSLKVVLLYLRRARAGVDDGGKALARARAQEQRALAAAAARQQRANALAARRNVAYASACQPLTNSAAAEPENQQLTDEVGRLADEVAALRNQIATLEAGSTSGHTAARPRRTHTRRHRPATPARTTVLRIRVRSSTSPSTGGRVKRTRITLGSGRRVIRRK